MITREMKGILGSNRGHLPMCSWFTGRTTRPRAATGEASLSSDAETHYPALELRVNWDSHYALLRAQHPKIKQKYSQPQNPLASK